MLVTGATGYIGGRLVPILLESGYAVRVLARNPDKLRDVPWLDRVELVVGDLLYAETLAEACEDIDAIYYLVHSMGTTGHTRDFDSLERAAVRNLIGAAERASVNRLIYLGGLHPEGGKLSRHLASRTDVGDALLASRIPALVYQAGVVIGSGSASFEMIRHLTEVLPWMPAPKWVNNKIQPIAVRDVLYYLVGALEVPGEVNRAVDIGGPDVLTYGQMMNGYAAEAGLPRRRITALPVLTPRLASHWVNLVTPIPRSLAMPLVESLQNDCVMSNHDIDSLVPPPAEGLTGYRRAVRLALDKLRNGTVETSWQDSSVRDAPSDPIPSDPEWAGYRVYTDSRERLTSAGREDLWAIIEGIGGKRGWYSMSLAWTLRGVMDKAVGGVGLRRGRRNPDTLNMGDALDFWRVEQVDHGKLLRLRAEMKVPGTAWLEMSVVSVGGAMKYVQRAVFFPRGLWGRLYWYSVLPFHGIIFSSMVKRITHAAEVRSEFRTEFRSEFRAGS